MNTFERMEKGMGASNFFLGVYPATCLFTTINEGGTSQKIIANDVFQFHYWILNLKELMSCL